MKKTLLFLLLLAAFYSNAQTSCASALPFCAGGVSGITFPATTSTPAATAENGPDYGCLGSEPNPAWYYLQIGASGSLDILIQGQIGTGVGQDVDFICWGPFNTLAGICNSLTATFSVDCSYSGSPTETLNITNGITGQYYMVLITNFANVQQNIIFTQTGGTGNTNCSLLTNNAAICAGNSTTLVATNSSSLTNPTYSIQPGGATNTTGSFVVSPLATTDYTLFISGGSPSSGVITQTAVSTVTVNSQPSAAPTSTQTSCTSTVNGFDLNPSFNPASFRKRQRVAAL